MVQHGQHDVVLATYTDLDQTSLFN